MTNDVNAKSFPFLTMAIFFLGLVSVGSMGWNLTQKYLQTKQISQIQAANDLLGQNKYAAAIAAYDQLLEADPNQSYILWANRGAALLGLNQYQQALESCKKATSLESQADLAWNCRGESLYYLDQQQSALAAVEKAIAINPNNATFWLNQNQILFALSKHQQAISASQKAIALLKSQPSNSSQSEHLAIAWEQQGQSLLKLQQNQPALAAFNESLTYQPDHLFTLQGRGIALYRLEFYPEALKIFERILLDPNLSSEQRAINLLYQGISLCHTSQAAKATKIFAQVIELTPDSQVQTIAQAGCGIH